MMKQMTLRIPDNLRKKVGHEAVEREMNVNQCIIVLLEEALEASRLRTPSKTHAPQES